MEVRSADNLLSWKPLANMMERKNIVPKLKCCTKCWWFSCLKICAMKTTEFWLILCAHCRVSVCGGHCEPWAQTRDAVFLRRKWKLKPCPEISSWLNESFGLAPMYFAPYKMQEAIQAIGTPVEIDNLWILRNSTCLIFLDALYACKIWIKQSRFAVTKG